MGTRANFAGLAFLCYDYVIRFLKRRARIKIIMKNLKWRLGKLPTPDEVLKLVNDKLITKEEARDILFNEEEILPITVEEENLKSEIKFLRELVEQISKNRSTVIETIKYVEKPYYNYQWFQPYAVYCSSTNGQTYVSGTTATGLSASNNSINSLVGSLSNDVSFTDIQTF